MSLAACLMDFDAYDASGPMTTTTTATGTTTTATTTGGDGGQGGTGGAGGTTTSAGGGGGMTLLPDGADCNNGNQCSSDNCIDGVCCATDCAGLCRRCDIAGSEGTCTNIPAGQDPDNECGSPPSKNCDGTGQCE